MKKARYITVNGSTILTRRIGRTTYRVKAHFEEKETATVEDKIMKLIQLEGLASEVECGKIDVPQTSRQSERSA